MKLTLASVLMFLLFGLPSRAQDKLDSAFHASDFVVKGKVVEHQFTWTHDLGTEHHSITIKVEEVYKSNRQVELNGNIYCSTILSNMHYKEGKMDVVFEPYEKESHTFFLNDTDFTMSGRLWNEIFIKPTSAAFDKELKKLADDERISIEHIVYEKTCAQDCKLCKAISEKNWNSVERQLKHYINTHQKEEPSWQEWLNTHRCVEYILAPEAILSSLPSWGHYGIRFNCGGELNEVLVGLRFGTVHKVAGLMVSIDESETTMISFELHPGYTQEFIGNLKWSWNVTVTDTNRPAAYPLMEIPDEWYIYSYLHGRTGYAYNLHPTVEYLWLETLKTLKEEGDVYSLCMASKHFHHAIRYESLSTLGELGDKRAIPYLIMLAEFNAGLDISQYGEKEQAELTNYFQMLSETLNKLTHCKVEIVRINTTEQDRLRLGIPVWKSKIKVISSI